MSEEIKQEGPKPSSAGAEEKYNPFAADFSKETLEAWLKEPLSEDIKNIPGVDYKTANLLSISSPAGDGISTSFQLLGVFLLCKGLGVQTSENCDRFHAWLKAKGVTSRTSTIVKACAEKCNVFFPGIYDGTITTIFLFLKHAFLSLHCIFTLAQNRFLYRRLVQPSPQSNLSVSVLYVCRE